MISRFFYQFQSKFDSRFRPNNHPKRIIKKCAFDIDSLLKPSCNSPISSYALVNQLKTFSSSFESEHSIVQTMNSKTKFKRIRTIFTTEQLEKLEAEFEKQQYMVGSERLYLAKRLHLSEAQVKVKFLSNQ